jgi:glutathione S-transferase
VIEEDAWILPESSVILEYLEERYPEPPLWPADAGERAAARLLVFRFDDFGDAYYAVRRGEPGGDAALAVELAALDALLSAAPFLTGREFGLADISYLPWLLRLRDLMGISLDAYPAVLGWIDACAERPSVASEIETVASLVA